MLIVVGVAAVFRTLPAFTVVSCLALALLALGLVLYLIVVYLTLAAFELRGGSGFARLVLSIRTVAAATGPESTYR